MKGIQDTSSETFRQLLGNGLKYEIPKFQRDYSWENEQWDDLWQDIQLIRNEEEIAHYMGYLVLQTSDNKSFKVIDGQQRMTTLSIMILASLKSLQNLIDQDHDAENNKKRIDNLRNSYIGYMNPVTLVSQNKLMLNRNNDSFYKQYIVTLQDFPKRGLNASEKLMKSCFEWYYYKVKSQYKTGQAIAAFIDDIVDKLFFTVIKVGDELNAFKVFETLNARGVQLSSADLLKNYLFSVVDSKDAHISEIQEMESYWAKIIGNLGSEKFPEFLRVFWNSRNKTIRKRELFKTIRKSIKTKGEAFELVRELNRNTDVYIALKNPNDELWRGDPEIINGVKELKIFQVKQPFSLLLSAYNNLSKSEFKKVLKACSVISFRYNVISGSNPNEQEIMYNDCALRIVEDSKFKTEWLRSIYPNDETFDVDFANKQFKRSTRNNKIVKYIFSKIEKQVYGTEVDPLTDTYSIEHILPENPQENWEQFDDDAIERCVYRLGNMTLLESKVNKNIGTSNYPDKAGSYLSSSIELTRSIPDKYSEWNEDSINARQNELAKYAKGVWKLNF